MPARVEPARRAKKGNYVAQKVQVLLVDDIDGGVASETVTFALDGTSYEIDLSEENARKLRDSLSMFVASGRRVSARSTGARGRGRSSSTAGAPSNAGRTAEVRQWAKDNGHSVSERGRVPSAILDAYEKAHA